MKLSISDCNICPRLCMVNRYKTVGYCNAGSKMKINVHQLHRGEEPNLSGSNGSGTIFFSYCNLKCVYCQNFTISQFGWGKEIEQTELVETMLLLQEEGAHNINLVTPTQYSLQLIKTIKAAKSEGLIIPIVWNTNSYERVETLKELRGLVDIYLPDLRYYDDKNAKIYSDAEDYFKVASAAIKEMFQQVGHIQEKEGIAVRGLMIRLLVLPENKNSIDKLIEWIFRNLGKETNISLMGQYYPTYRSVSFPVINRPVSREEYQYVLDILDKYGFENGYVQDLGGSEDWTPKFFEQH